MNVCLLGGHVVVLEGCGHQSDHTHTHTYVHTLAPWPRQNPALVIVM